MFCTSNLLFTVAICSLNSVCNVYFQRFVLLAMYKNQKIFKRFLTAYVYLTITAMENIRLA